MPEGDDADARLARVIATAVREQVAEALADERAPRRLPGVVGADTITLGDVWPLYELAEKSNLGDWRTEDYRWRSHISQPFGPDLKHSFKTLPVVEITPLLIDIYRAHRLDEWTEKTKRKTSIATVNREIARIRRLLYFAVERKLIPFSPLAGLKTGVLIKDEHNVRQTVVEEFHPEAEFTIFDLVKVATPVMRAAIWMSHGTGLRREEMSLARWERLDLRTRILFVPDVDTKGGSGGREVMLRPEAIEAILDLPRDFRFRSGYLLANPNTGRHYHKDYFTKGFRTTCEAAGVTGPDGSVWFHDLRRSFVTLTRRRGEDTTSIMNQTGHKTPSVFKRYNIFSRKDLITAGRRQEKAREDERAEFEDLRKQLGERMAAQRSAHRPTSTARKLPAKNSQAKKY